MCRYWLAAVVGLVTWLSAGVPAWGLTAVPPMPGPVVRGFDPPAQPWLAGHRGVDVLGSPGEPVVAAAAGVVSFAGNLAGRAVVVVDHGDVRTTYLPLTPTVAVGTRVSAGQTIAEPLGKTLSPHLFRTTAHVIWSSGVFHCHPVGVKETEGSAGIPITWLPNGARIYEIAC